MTSPYVVSGPVWGEQFYGRKSLIADITGGVYRALFVMGTRQIGKTSLLRQLNTLAPALCLDLQLVGGSPDKLTHLVRQELRRKRERFPWLPQAEAVDGEDLFGILEMADDAADSAGATLLLLVDEAEALRRIAQSDPTFLEQLRGQMQRSHALRAVLVAAKRLADLGSDLETSPFFSGVAVAYLGRLSPEESLALLRQSQSESPTEVDDDVARELIVLTNGHPLLLQLLGERLYSDGRLRAPIQDDLAAVQLKVEATGSFPADFKNLSGVERRILRALRDVEQATEEQLQAKITRSRLPTFLHGLTQLGYLRREGETYTVGNHFLARWLESDAPPWEEQSDLSDDVMYHTYSGHGQRVFPPMPYCFKVGVPGCPKNVTPDPQRVFVGLPADVHDPFKYGIVPALKAVGLTAYRTEESISNVDRLCRACQGIQSSRYALLDVSAWDANVLFYLGLAYGLGREVVFIKRHGSEVPLALEGMECLEYAHADELREKLVRFFQGKLKKR